MYQISPAFETLLGLKIEIDTLWKMKINIKILIFNKVTIFVKSKMLVLVIKIFSPLRMIPATKEMNLTFEIDSASAINCILFVGVEGVD